MQAYGAMAGRHLPHCNPTKGVNVRRPTRINGCPASGKNINIYEGVQYVMTPRGILVNCPVCGKEVKLRSFSTQVKGAHSFIPFHQTPAHIKIV